MTKLIFIVKLMFEARQQGKGTFADYYYIKRQRWCGRRAPLARFKAILEEQRSRGKARHPLPDT